MDSLKFSIIVPVYNAAVYLQSLLNQLQNQTNQNFEILFINDCSSDNSAEILNQLIGNDERVHVFHHEKNLCQGVARNTGLDNARGEYIIYIDADDSIPNHYLESLLRPIEKEKADIAICNSIWEYLDHEEYHNMFLIDPNISEMTLTGEEALMFFFNIYKNDIRIPVEPWGRIIRRSFIEKYHLRNPSTLYEDIVMSFSELLFANKVVLINDYLYYYNRKNASAVTIERKKQYILDFPQVFVGIQKVLQEHGLYEQQKKWLTRFYFRYLAGVYEFHAKGDHYPDEMRQAILRYRTIFKDPLINGSEEFISNQLFCFELEMERNNMQELFTLFIEVHPEVYPLLKHNFRVSLIRILNLFMRNKSVRYIYKKIKEKHQ